MTSERNNNKKKSSLGRRSFLRKVGTGAGVVAGAGAMAPYIWIPRANASTSAFNTVKHLIYVRLSGGFRFTTAFNGDVAEKFNPFGLASNVASGTEWGPSALLGGNSWLTDELRALGVRSVPEMANQMAVIPCVDHEPFAGGADGNHQTGLERYLTGYVGGETGLFTMINYGLRARYEQALEDGVIILPAVIMGDAVMGRGAGKYAPYRPPVLRGDDLDRFGFDVDSVVPSWARELSNNHDARYRADVNLDHYPRIDGYIQSRAATKAYADIFASEALKIGTPSDTLYDGISNNELATVFGNSGTARNLRLALRLFKYGCPAVYMDQGGYDYHSGELMELPDRLLELNQFIAGLEYVLKKMNHDEEGYNYWDNTMVVFGSEFSRTSYGGRFNSANGSDHNSDWETRWMSMPFMGGPVIGGRSRGSTSKNTLEAQGFWPSYRSTFKTLMDVLGCDHAEFFEADAPFENLWLP